MRCAIILCTPIHWHAWHSHNPNHASVSCRKAYTRSSSSSHTFCRYVCSTVRHTGLLDVFNIVKSCSTVLGCRMCWGPEDAGEWKLHAFEVLMQHVTC